MLKELHKLTLDTYNVAS